MAGETRDIAERIARRSYGRLLAILSVRLKDVATAEDALAGAFEQALARWPADGVPKNPEGWLVTVARNRARDDWRHRAVAEAAIPALTALLDEAEETQGDPLYRDERLKLLFVCAHPAIDAGAHTPLMLQTVLGLDAARIGSAFLVSPAAMGQRLVRAKTKIRQAGISFDIPDADRLPERMEAVLAAIYAAYGTGWDHAPIAEDGSDGREKLAGLAEEALFLGRLAVDLQLDDPEAKGLLALMLYTAARRDARRGAHGAYVPLDEQETARWDKRMISHAERLLMAASRAGKPGRYQLEAAIQSAHVKGRLSGRANWPAIVTLYRALVKYAPSLGAQVGLAGAMARSGELPGALALLDTLEERARTYQPWWAVRAHCLSMAGKAAEAASAYDRAIGLAEDPAVRAWLTARKTGLCEG